MGVTYCSVSAGGCRANVSALFYLLKGSAAEDTDAPQP
jgi:hypothetical protein